MNPTLQTLQAHRTYRQFDPEARIPAEQLQAILDATHQAPSWMNGQHYTIIRITDPALRQQIVERQPNNPQIGTCSEYWIFVADVRLAYLCSEAAGGSFGAHFSNGQPDEATRQALAEVTARLSAKLG